MIQPINSKLTELGKALREHRLQLSLPQRTLSLSLGWAPSRIKSIEFGSLVTDKELAQLADAFKLDAVPSLWYDLRKLSKQAPQLSRHIGNTERLSPFGKFLRNTRTILGITQDQLAKALDVRNASLVRLEYGETKKPQKLVLPILFALGFPAEVSEQIARTFDANGDWQDSISTEKRAAIVKEWYASNVFANTLTAETQTERPSRLAEVLQRLQDASGTQNLSHLPPFGTELRRLCDELGITSDVFCKKTKLSSSRLAQLEQGYLPVDSKLLKTIAKGLGLPSVPDNWPELVIASHQAPDYESPFGRFLQMARRARRISRMSLASHIGLTPPTLQRLIRGTTTLTQDRLNLAFETLNISDAVAAEIRSVVDAQGQFSDPKTKVLLSEDKVQCLLHKWLQAVRSQEGFSS